MTVVAEASPVTLEASSTAEAGPQQGIIVVTIQVEAAAGARLVLSVHGRPPFEKPLAAGPQSFWLGLHGHLLPNGPAPVSLKVVVGDRTLAERRLTVQVRNEGATARQVAESLAAGGAPLVIDGCCDSGFYGYGDPALTAWFDRPEPEALAHVADLAARGEVSAVEADALSQFVTDGYLEMPGLVGPEHLARLNAALDDAVARKVEGYEWGESRRIHNLHDRYPAIRELWLHPQVLRMLGLIFGERAKPCQTLTYVFGSEQQYHQDTVALTPFPPGRMCGVWTALEDVQEGSGELVVFPGSHRAQRVYMRDVGLPKVVGDDWSGFIEKVVPIWTEIRARHRREVYRPKAGTVLIWHENLLHAGSPRAHREKSRRSIVGHYFADGAIVYYDNTGMPGFVHEAV